jgi:hypothetical protein
MGNHMKIPSVISYSLRSQANEQQWGTDLSPQAIAMVHTKLQIDVDKTSAELDLILQALDGMHDLNFQYIIDAGAEKYTRKGPEEIVSNYMMKMFDYLLKAVAPFTEALRKTIPVDIVATVPAVSLLERTKLSECRLSSMTRVGVIGPRTPYFEHSRKPDSIKKFFHDSERCCLSQSPRRLPSTRPDF